MKASETSLQICALTELVRVVFLVEFAMMTCQTDWYDFGRAVTLSVTMSPCTVTGAGTSASDLGKLTFDISSCAVLLRTTFSVVMLK